MKERIKWPAGNRLDLCIPLRKITVTEEGTQFGEYIPSQAAVVMVYFVGNYASYEYTPRIEDNKLFITDNGELKPGVYAIDVRIQEPERKLRSFRCGELEIVRETKQLALGDFVLDNNITLDADAFIFGEGPSAFEVAVRDGYTGTKAEWLESLRGREGRGIADIVSLPTGAFRILLTDGSAYVTPILKGEQGVSIVDFTVSSITSQEVICTITMSDGTTHQLNLPRGEKGEQGDAGEDGRGIQSVVMNNDYTITFSYTDGTSYTTPQALRGEKGENGQDGQDGRGISSMAIDDDNHLTVNYTDGSTYTTPQSLQGERGVSITDFEQVGESATMTFFNIYFSNGNISQIGLPKGEQGDRGEQGPQGPKGDTVVLGEVGEYKLYNVGGTATDGAMTQDATTKAIATASGYYECSTAAGTAAKVAVGDNEALYSLQKGGSIKVKMTNANAAASGVTLKIGSAAATPLYYNNEPVSASNTWEAGEVVEVYYDGTNYQATNAQGDGGKAEKIKYENSQSILSTENVQDTLDGITDELVFEDATDLSFGTTRNWSINGSGNYVVASGYQCYMKRVYPGQKFRIKANSEHVAFYAFMASNPSSVTKGNPANFVTGYETRYTIPIGEAGSFTIPDAEGNIYLYIQKQTSSDFTPVYLHRLSTVKENIDNEIYSKDSLQLTTESNLTIEDATATEITASDNVNYTILYCAVNEGEILHITASNVSIKRFIISFSTEEPATDVAVTDVQDIRSTTIDELVKAPVTGYLVLSKYLTYYTDLKVNKINGELADIVMDDNIKLNAIDKKVNGYVPIIGLTTNTFRQLLSIDTLKWSQVQTGEVTNRMYTSRIVPVSQYAGKVLVVTLGEGNNLANVALLSDDAHEPGEFGHFSRPWDKYIKLTAENPSVKILLTENDKYLYYQVMNSTASNDLTPSFRIEEENKEVFDAAENYNLTLDRTNYNLDVKDEETNPDGIELLNVYIVLGTNVWSHSSSVARGFFLDVSAHKGGYLFVSNNNERCYLAFLRDNSNCNTQNMLPSYATGSTREIVPTGYRIKYDIPTDANLVFFGYNNSDEQVQYPCGVFAIGKDIGGSTEVARTLDRGHVILQKKANQFFNLKWTAKSNIASKNNGNAIYVAAGEQSGMLYSSVQEYDRCVGHDVSLKTFMTAVNNPYSLLYTEDLYAGTSGYDFTYESSPGSGSSTVHGFFGTVCSRFVCMCYAMEEFSTGNFAWLYNAGYLTKIKDQSAQGVEIGDTIWVPGHVQLVTNYVKNNGVVTSVTITEAAQPLVKLTIKTAAEFDDYLNAATGSGNSHGPGFIYRYNDIYKNVTYEPSPFVAIDDEVISSEYQYNNDICTYAGDYAAFRLKGDNDTRKDWQVWLNYNLGDEPSHEWTAIQLYKESRNDNNELSLTLVNTYSDVDFTAHRYMIPAADISTAGKYRARLTDGTNNSDYTYFEIIDTDVSYTKNGDIITVEFSSSNGYPRKIVVCTKSGSHRAVRLLTQEERLNGVVSFNPKSLNKLQTSAAYSTDDAYIKVFFMGEYGRVTNEPLKIDYNS